MMCLHRLAMGGTLDGTELSTTSRQDEGKFLEWTVHSRRRFTPPVVPRRSGDRERRAEDLAEKRRFERAVTGSG